MLGYLALALCLCPVFLAWFTTSRWSRPQQWWAAVPCWVALASVTVVLAIWWIWGIERGWSDRGLPGGLAWPVLGLGAVACLTQVVEWLLWRRAAFQRYVPRRMM